MKSALHNDDDKHRKMKKTKKHVDNVENINKLLTQLNTAVPQPIPDKNTSLPAALPTVPPVQAVPPVHNNVEKINVVDLPPLPEAFFKLLEEKLGPLVQQEMHDKERARDATPEDLKHLETHVSEYLKTFAILGYNLKGEKIVLVHAPTVQDHDALIEHLRQTFMRVIGNIEMGQ